MDELLHAAMLGTSRQTLRNPEATDKLAAWADQAAAGSPERRLLLEAGARWVFALAGYTEKTALPPPPSAQREALAACPDKVGELLADLFKRRLPQEVLTETLRGMADRGWCIPPRLLPEALSITEPVERALLQPLLGERGRWLAQFREEWRWARGPQAAPALEELERVWNEGKIAERCRALKMARGADPRLAREWLIEAWSQEKADARRELLGGLATRLGPEDEAFLEQALTDRSKEVRALAADLLSQLMDSRYSQWLWQLAKGLLRFAPAGRSFNLRPYGIWQLAKGLLRYAPPKASSEASRRGSVAAQTQPATSFVPALEISLPAAFDPNWASQGLIEQVPPGTSNREFWFWQIVRRVPLARWVEHFRCTPTELAAAAAGSSTLVLLAAWSEAAVSSGATDWFGPLFDAWLARGELENTSFWGIAGWKAFMTIAASSKLPDAGERLKKLAAWDSGGEIFCKVLEQMPAPWSTEVSRMVFDQFKARLVGARSKAVAKLFHWLEALAVAARRMNHVCLDTVALWAADIEESEPLAQHREFIRFRDVIDLRRQVARTLAAYSPEHREHGKNQV